MSLGSLWLPTDTCAKFWVLSGGESPTVPVRVSGSGEGPSLPFWFPSCTKWCRRANAFSMAALTVPQTSIQTSGVTTGSDGCKDALTLWSCSGS